MEPVKVEVTDYPASVSTEKQIKTEPVDIDEPSETTAYTDNCVWFPVKQEITEALCEEDINYEYLDVKIENLRQADEKDPEQISPLVAALNAKSEFCEQPDNLLIVKSIESTAVEETEKWNKSVPETAENLLADDAQKDPTKPYMCAVCGKRFKAKHDFTKHSRVHTGVRPYSCKECDKSFTQIGHLTVHLRVHNGVKPYKCTLCPMKFTTRGALKNHDLVHTGHKPFECEHCKKTFARADHYKAHQLTHTGVKPFACNICHKQFSAKYDVKKHLRVHSAVKYTCNVCQKIFKSEKYLAVHVRAHSGIIPYKCDICEKPFSDKYFLKRHIKKHSPEYVEQKLEKEIKPKEKHQSQPIKCEACDKVFLFNSHMQIHYARVHSELTPYECELCQKQFHTIHDLKRHLKSHSEKTYQCELCKKMFRRKAYLKAHFQMHTKPEEVKCDVCNKTFKYLKTLAKHIKTHASEDKGEASEQT